MGSQEDEKAIRFFSLINMKGITGAQEPSGIPYIAPITESRGPARSGGKRPRPNSSLVFGRDRILILNMIRNNHWDLQTVSIFFQLDGKIVFGRFWCKFPKTGSMESERSVSNVNFVKKASMRIDLWTFISKFWSKNILQSWESNPPSWDKTTKAGISVQLVNVS